MLRFSVACICPDIYLEGRMRLLFKINISIYYISLAIIFYKGRVSLDSLQAQIHFCSKA